MMNLQGEQPSCNSIEDRLLQKLSRMRKWKKTRLIARTSRHRRGFDFQFTVMTYNILSQTALNNHRYLYKNSKCLGERYRISRIIPEIRSSSCSIVCLQEVEEDIFEHCIKPEMDAEGFSALYKRRTGDKSDGCAILWRRHMFDLVDYWDLELKTADHKLLDRDNVALVAVLRPRHPDCRDTLLHVATTHLLYNPKRGDVKLCQLRWLVAELEQMAFKRETPDGDRQYHPIVLCGDFNFEPFSPLYRFVQEGKLEVDDKTLYGDLAGQAEGKGKGKLANPKELSLHKLGIGVTTRLEKGDLKPSSEKKVKAEDVDESSGEKKTTFRHDIKFAPAYKFTEEEIEDLPFTSMTKKTFSTVDHIFYTVREKKDGGSYTEGKLRLMYTYTLPSPAEGKELGSLPNELLGSDHICLMAQFGLDFRR